MTSRLKSYAEFDEALGDARSRLDRLSGEHPEERPLESIKKQLEALHSWTRDGKKPAQTQKDSLNFGLLASRHVDDLDFDLSNQLHELQSWVVYW